MDLTCYVNTFGRYLKGKYGEKVHKLSVDAEFTCPNRDGTKGIGGCTFCNNASFVPSSTQAGSVRAQLETAKERVSTRTNAGKFIAYFQSYSNTYAEIEKLKELYDEALSCPDIIGLAVGTRPDCVPDPVLELLASYQKAGFEIWLELGLQSSFDASLERINRGHTFADYIDAVKRAQGFGLKLCTHLIMGLPGEAPEDVLTSFDRVIELGVDAIKVHPLHIVRGTQLAREWKAGDVRELTMEEYADNVAEIVRRAPKELIFHRLHGAGQRQYLLAPEWCMHKWDVLKAIGERLEANPPKHLQA